MSPCQATRELLAKIANARDQLFTFCDAPGNLDVTNNACERLFRPSVIQRKVTNGHRSAWVAQMEAKARTVTKAFAGTPASRPSSLLLAERRRSKNGVGNYEQLNVGCLVEAGHSQAVGMAPMFASIRAFRSAGSAFGG